MRRMAALAGVVLLVTMAAARSAPDPAPPTGRWDREDGLGGIDIVPCGDALCGTVAWLRDRDTPAFVGQRVLFNMRRAAADQWAGSALNPEDGRTYAGTMTLAGSRLLTRGCLFGGLICRSVGLVRPRQP